MNLITNMTITNSYCIHHLFIDLSNKINIYFNTFLSDIVRKVTKIRKIPPKFPWQKYLSERKYGI